MDSLSLIKCPIEAEFEEFKILFDAAFFSASPNALLGSVLEHIRQKRGKMMRPMLVLLVARLWGAVMPATLHAAVSLELLHTASLVHDDVVDESTERRGQRSVCAIFDNKVAVLAGDYLLATALMEVKRTGNLDIVDTVSSLGRDLAEGELLQLSNVNDAHLSEAAYYDVIRKKTAALFSACTKAAALSVEADSGRVDFARSLGERIGICFQIKDDIFDYYENPGIGKPTGNDMLEGKLTLPVLYALNSTQDAAALELALKVKAGTATTDEIARLVQFTKEHGGIEYAVASMHRYRDEALAQLAGLADTDVRRALEAYVAYVVNRDK